MLVFLLKFTRGSTLNFSHFLTLALYWASYGGHVEVVKKLLESKFIEINTQNKLGDTALIAASIKGRAEVVQALVTAGADTCLKNNAGEDAKLAANDPSGKIDFLKKKL